MGQVLSQFTDQPGKEEGEVPVVVLALPRRKLNWEESEYEFAGEESPEMGEQLDSPGEEKVPDAEPVPEAVIRICCHTCGRKLKVAAKHAGRFAKCPDCGDSVPIKPMAGGVVS